MTPVTRFLGVATTGANYNRAEESMQIQARIGAYQIPDTPIQTWSEAYFRLAQTVGRHWGSEALSTTPTEYRQGRFIIGLPLERAGTSPGLSVAYSGISTRGGDLTCISLQLGAPPYLVHTVLTFHAVLSLSIAGVRVED